MTAIQTIGTQIAKLRKERNITQEELAKNLDISAQAVSKWENGGSPDLELLPKIADYFETTIDYLFGRGKARMESGFTQNDFLERLDALQKELLENSYLYNDTIKSLVALEFEDDEAKRDSIDLISGTFCSKNEIQRMIMQNYQRMYEQTLNTERKK